MPQNNEVPKEIPKEVPIIDIHMHAIPGVDDGSTSVEMSLEMLRSAYEQGARAVFMTSHGGGVAEDIERYYAALDVLQYECEEMMPDLQLLDGSEVLVFPENIDEVIELLNSGELPTLGGTEYVLTELFDYEEATERVKHCLQAMLDAGYIPVLAHVERYDDILGSVDVVKELKEMGCLVQINLYSVAEESNKVRRYWANAMLKDKLVDFVGTDAHRMTYRPPKYRIGVEAILKKCDREYAEAILHGNAERLLLN